MYLVSPSLPHSYYYEIRLSIARKKQFYFLKFSFYNYGIN